jgi:mono/diheme cytochrome c family protein
VFTALNGDAVVPPVVSAAGGVAATTVDSAAQTVTVHVNTDGVSDASEAHVHRGSDDENNADAFLTLEKDPVDADHWSIELQPVTAADIAEFESNGWYVDVHTPANPDGELRGQIAPNPEPSPPAATLAELQSSVFTPTCATCHTGGGSVLPASMNLSSAADTHAALVGVASIGRPALLRVAAGDSENSYLIHKLEGQPGIDGDRMPLGGPFLSDATIDRVRSWIDAGAENN